MRASWIIVAVGLLAATANGAIKRWTGPDNNYDNTKNWMGGSLPCSADNATFAPTWSPTTVFIQNNIEVHSLILPIDGTIVFLKSLNITLGGQPTAKCSGSNTVFKGQKPGNWDDPTNWETLDSSTNAVVSTATFSASDRLPCAADTVRFLPQTAVTVQLNRPVTVHQFIINNQAMGPATLSQFLNSQQGLGQFRLPSTSAITLGPGCPFGSLCKCGNAVPDVLRSVCSYSNPSCSAMSGCLGPVMLAGDCCAVCGAIMNITSSYLDTRSLNAELGTQLNGMQHRVQVIDSSHVQVLIVGNKGLAKAQQIKTAILLSPSAYGLNSKAQIVVSGSVVPTTQPPTMHEIETVKADPGKCVIIKVVTDAEGREVTDQAGAKVTDIVTKDFEEPTGVNVGNNAGQSSTTGTDYTPWYAAGGVAALLVLVLIVVVIILARRKEPKASLRDVRAHPVHYVHHNSPGGDQRVSMSDFDNTGTATQLDLYEDIRGYAAGGVANPIYQGGDDPIEDDDRIGIIQ